MRRGLPPELAGLLEQRRLAQGLSRSTVGAAVGVTTPTIFKYERSQLTPSRPVARALAAVLGLDRTSAAMLDALAQPEVR